MVQIGDFEVQLVDAATKRPFREHLQRRGDGGRVYVEVELGVNYFISVRKNKVSQNHLLLHYYVDGKDLGCEHFVKSDDVNTAGEPHYQGIVSAERSSPAARFGRRGEVSFVEDDDCGVPSMSTTNALRFVKSTRLTSRRGGGGDGDGSGGSAFIGRARAPLMSSHIGEIQIRVYSANYLGTEDITEEAELPPPPYIKKLLSIVGTESNIHNSDLGVVVQRTNLSYGEGTAMLGSTNTAGSGGGSFGMRRSTRPVFARASLCPLYTMTLYYCTLSGLVDVGIMTEWERHKRMFPYDSKSEQRSDSQLDKAVITKKTWRTPYGRKGEQDLIDLSHIPDDVVVEQEKGDAEKAKNNEAT